MSRRIDPQRLERMRRNVFTADAGKVNGKMVERWEPDPNFRTPREAAMELAQRILIEAQEEFERQAGYPL